MSGFDATTSIEAMRPLAAAGPIARAFIPASSSGSICACATRHTNNDRTTIVCFFMGGDCIRSLLLRLSAESQDRLRELVDVERLGDDELHDVEVEIGESLLRDGGNDRHGCVGLFLLQKLDHLESVDFRNHEIEHDDRIAL